MSDNKKDNLEEKIKNAKRKTERLMGKTGSSFNEKSKSSKNNQSKNLNKTSRFFERLKNIYNFAAYERKDGEFVLDAAGERIFSAKRLKRSSIITAASATALYIGISAAYFYGTQFEETIVTTGKNEVIPGEKYTFTGSTEVKSETDNSMYYQISETYIFPTLLFPEEDVYANIPVNSAICEVKGYGIYFKALKPLQKRLQWYPEVYDCKCRPLTQDEIDSGIIDSKLSTDSLDQRLPDIPASLDL